MLHHWLQPRTSLPQETQVIVHVHIIWNLSTLQVENVRTQDWLCRSTENVWALPSHAAKNRMLRTLPAESRFLYAKHSSSALTNRDKPTQNLDQSKRWRVPWSQQQHLHQTQPHTTQIWKFWGTTSPMCQTRGLNSSVKLPAFQPETNLSPLFSFMLGSVQLASVVVALCKKRMGVWHLGDSNHFHWHVLLQVSFIGQWSTLRIHDQRYGKSSSGQKCSLAPPPLVSLSVIRVICHWSAWSIEDPFKYAHAHSSHCTEWNPPSSTAMPKHYLLQ